MQRIGRSIAGLAVITVAALSVLALLWTVSASRPARTGAPAGPLPVTATAVPATATPVSPLPTPTPPWEISIDDYQFGEPQLILSRSNIPLLIGDWLPDIQKTVLVTATNDSFSDGFAEIATLSLATGQTEIYGRRASEFIPRKPIWLADLGKMAFIGADPNLPRPEHSLRPQHLWLTSSGTVSLTNPLLENVNAATGHGHTVLAIQCSANTVLSVDAATGAHTALPVDLSTYGFDTCGSYLQMVQHPNLLLAAIFDPHNFIVLNLATGEIHEIDLGEVNSEVDYGKLWASVAAWNPATDRLAVAAMTGLPAHLMHLMTVDVDGGPVNEIPSPLTWISDIAWAPNGKQILLQGQQSTTLEQEFYLLDTYTNEVRQIDLFPPSTFGSLRGWNLGWLPDGSKLIASQGDRLYTIDVTVQPSGELR